MQIVIRENPTSPPERVEVDLRDPPAVIRPAQHPRLRQPVSLDWDRAIDDRYHLRRCPVCRCEDLYARRTIPRVTAFILILLAGVVAMLLFGMQMAGWAVAALSVVLVVDIGILMLSRQILVCYGCKTQYRGLKVPRLHPKWDAATADRHRDAPSPFTPPPVQTPAPPLAPDKAEMT